MSEIFGKNIKYLRTKQKLKQSEMLDSTGVSDSTWSDYERGKTEPDFAVLKSVSEFFGVYIDDLICNDVAVLDATGNLIPKSADSENSQIGNLKGNVIGNLKAINNRGYRHLNTSELPVLKEESVQLRPLLKSPTIITIDSSGKENVLYVPVKARAGYLSGHSDPEFISTLPAYQLPGYNNGSYRIFEIQGVSMFPTFQDKDRCVTRWSQVSEIRDDRVYVLVTRNDGLLIKRLINRSQEGKIICKSDNNHSGEYPSIVLDVSEIVEVWYVVERWTRQLPGPGEIYKRIVNLEAELTLIKHRLGDFK